MWDRLERAWFPWALLTVLVLWSAVPVAVLLKHVVLHGGVLTGSDGALAGSDQQLYLTFVSSSARHLLISNEFRLGASSAVYLHPMYALSGLLAWLGVDAKIALWLWKPVAAVAIAVGAWGYVCRLLDPGRRLGAALLASFYFSPVLPVLVWTGVPLSSFDHLTLLFTSGEAMPGWQLWGYLHAAIVVGLMPLCLLALERGMQPERRRPGRSARWYLAWSAVAAAIIGWLHPWQGLTLVAILVGLAAWGRFGRSYRALALPAAAALAPIGYLYVLSRSDPDWRLLALQNRAPHAPLWVLLVALGPLVLAALAGVRGRMEGDHERMLLLWAPASIAVYMLMDQFPYHALQGVSLPLAVLAARGYGRWPIRRRPTAFACVAALTLPGMAFELYTLQASLASKVAPYWLTDSESSALRYLARAPLRGGVLSRYYLGMTVPAIAGRSVWVGETTWTPDFGGRVAAAERLFTGAMPAAEARRFVSSIGPAYVLADCHTRPDFEPLLGSLIASRHRFGCTTIYAIRQ